MDIINLFDSGKWRREVGHTGRKFYNRKIRRVLIKKEKNIAWSSREVRKIRNFGDTKRNKRWIRIIGRVWADKFPRPSSPLGKSGI